MLKRTIVLMLSIGLFFSTTYSQAIQQGDLFLNFGAGIGPTPRSTNSGNFPSLIGSFDFALHDYFTLGGYSGVGFKNVPNIKYNLFGIGATAGFHFWQLIADKTRDNIGSDKVDIYLNYSIGYQRERWANSNSDFNTLSESDIFMGPTVGLKYIPFDHVGFYVEGGKGALGFLNFGITVRM